LRQNISDLKRANEAAEARIAVLEKALKVWQSFGCPRCMNAQDPDVCLERYCPAKLARSALAHPGTQEGKTADNA
jgi:hypothetical protein